MAIGKIDRRLVLTEYRIDSRSVNETLQKMQVTAAGAAKSLRSLDASAKSTSLGMATLVKQARLVLSTFGVFAAYDVARMFLDLGDAATNVTARLESIAGSFDSIGTRAQTGQAIFEDLMGIATRLGVSVEDLSDTYVRLGVAVPTAEHNELIGTLDLLATTLATTGANTQASNSVLLQFAQGLGSAALAGDELK